VSATRDQGAPPDPQALYTHGAELLGRARAGGDRGLLHAAAAAFDGVIAALPDRPLGYVGRATALGELGQHARALADLDHALRVAPDLAPVHVLRGRQRAATGDAPGAIADFDRALALRPDLAPVLGERAVARMSLGDMEGALRDCDRWVELAPGTLEAYRRRALALEAAGRPEAALRDYDRLLQLGDDQAETHRNRGDVLLALDRPAAARRAYAAALTRQPDLKSAAWGLARACAAEGCHEDAIAAAGRVLALDPDDADAHRLLGQELAAVGQHEAAAEALAGALVADPLATDAYLGRARLHMEAGRPAAALRDFDAVLALEPACVPAHVGRGEALVALGEPERGVFDFERALSLAPSDPAALSGLVVAHFLHGDRFADERASPVRRRAYVEALHAAEKAAQRAPDDPAHLGYRVTALRLLDAVDHAVRVASEALAHGRDGATGPWRAWLARERGEALRQWGEMLGVREHLVEARAALAEAHALAATPEDRALAHELEGHTALALGDDVAALAAFAAARDDSPSAVWCRVGEGKAHLRAGRLEAALAAFEAALALAPPPGLAAWAATGRWLALERGGSREARDAEPASLPGKGARAYLARGERLEWLGAPDASLADRRLAVALDPGDPEALNALAWFLVEQGTGPRSLDEAEVLIAEALAALADDDVLHSYVLDTAGWVAFRRGRPQEARPHLERAVALDPHPLIGRVHLHACETALGLPSRALERGASAHG